MSDDPSLPLYGVKVLDLSRVLAGPMTAMSLGDLGAEVIKVEHPVRGDDTRDWGLPTGGNNTTYFNCANRNKRSIGLDLNQEQGREIVYRLAEQSDIVIHNFKPGGAEKLGLDYPKLSALNPRIIYCSIRGYNSNTSKGELPGYDVIIQAETGLMSLSGEAGQGPLKFGVAIVDISTSMYSTQAILASLYQRERTGKGREIEMSLFDCGMMINSYYGLDALLLQRDHPKYGNEHPTVIPYGVFQAKDGPVVIAAGNNKLYQGFCQHVLKRPDLAKDPRFITNTDRMKNRDALLAEIYQELAKLSRAELLAALRAQGIPGGEINGLLEALSSQQTRESGLVQTYSESGLEQLSVLAPPYQLDGRRPPIRRPPPGLGQNTDEVLRDSLGYSDTAIAELKSHGIC